MMAKYGTKSCLKRQEFNKEKKLQQTVKVFTKKPPILNEILSKALNNSIRNTLTVQKTKQS
jgi:hypothetical protein